MVTNRSSSLAQLFAEGSIIAAKKSSDLFKQLESQDLPTDEEDIIMKRVELQRRMLEEYDKRDKARKVSDIQEVCPEVMEQEALKALEMCSNREEEAAARLVEPAFLRRVRAALGTSNTIVPNRGRGTSAGSKRAKPTDQWSCPLAARGTSAGSKRAKPTDQSSCHDGVFFGSFRGRGFPAIAAARPGSAGQPEEPVQACSELAALVAQSLGERQKPGERATDPASSEVHPGNTLCQIGAKRAKPGTDALPSQRPSSAYRGHSAAEDRQDAATESPVASSPQPYTLMRELSDGTCQPCTTSEVAALKANEPPTRSPSVNPVRPLRTPMRPPLSPLGRPGLALAPGPQEESKSAAAHLQETDRQPEEAPEASAAKHAKQESRIPDQAVGHCQQSRELRTSSDKENGPSKSGRCQGSAPRGKAQQANSEDTVTISSLGTEGDTETDNESAPTRQGKRGQDQGSRKSGPCSRAKPAQRDRPLSDILNSSALPEASQRPGSAGEADTQNVARTGRKRAASGHRSAPPRRTASAISKSGHTRAGRVRQKSHKQAEIVSAGKLRAEPGWFNSGYIFPEGFASRVNFRSSIVLDVLCVHECSILGEEGQYWPAATFRVTSMDRADEPLDAKSCTGCWSQVLKRINAEIEARRTAGEDLPPPPKTAIAGPEYFGLNQPEIMEAIEALDPEHLCTDYWAGKNEREAAAAGLPMPSRAGAGRQAGAPRRRGNKRSRRGGSDSDSDEDEDVEGAGNRWSALLRQARYKKRYEADGDAGEYVDADNPLADFTDPITLQPVVNPAISSHGHVMGLQTWKAVLADSGLCPLTKQPLRWEALTVLTHGNIERYRALIRNSA